MYFPMAEMSVAEMSIGRNVRGRNVMAETSVAEMSVAEMSEHQSVYRVSKKNDNTFNRYLFLYYSLN